MNTMPTHLVRAAVDAVALLKARSLIGESKPDQEIAPAVTPAPRPAPSPSGEWSVRRGMAGSPYWHIETRAGAGVRVAVAHNEECARQIVAVPEMLAALRQIADEAEGQHADPRRALQHIANLARSALPSPASAGGT